MDRCLYFSNCKIVHGTNEHRFVSSCQIRRREEVQKIQKYVAGPLRAPPGTITTTVKEFKYRYDPSNSKRTSQRQRAQGAREEAEYAV